MNYEMDNDAMFRSLARCQSVVQSQRYRLVGDELRTSAAALVPYLDEIERVRHEADNLRVPGVELACKLDRLKRGFVSQLARFASVSGRRLDGPQNLVATRFWTEEDAAASPDTIDDRRAPPVCSSRK
jgi:hypothetical protein